MKLIKINPELGSYLNSHNTMTYKRFVVGAQMSRVQDAGKLVFGTVMLLQGGVRVFGAMSRANASVALFEVGDGVRRAKAAQMLGKELMVQQLLKRGIMETKNLKHLNNLDKGNMEYGTFKKTK